MSQQQLENLANPLRNVKRLQKRLRRDNFMQRELATILSHAIVNRKAIRNNVSTPQNNEIKNKIWDKIAENVSII